MSVSDYIQLATLFVVILYTIVTYRLLASQNTQSFENKFFRLLTLHHKIVNGIEGYSIGTTVKGRKNFEVFYSLFQEKYRVKLNNPNDDAQHNIIMKAYNEFLKICQSDLSHYFQNLYHIIKFIDGSNSNEKEFFVHLVRAQLSSHELLLLFYHCLSSYGLERLKPLVEKYSLLANMPEDELIDRKNQLPFEHKKLYKEKAFKEG